MNRPRRKYLDAQAQADRALCPPEVAEILELRGRDVAEAMRAVGREEPLTVDEAREIAGGSAPSWLAAVVEASAVRKAERSEVSQVQMREAYSRIEAALDAGDEHFEPENVAQELAVADMAATILHELGSDWTVDDLARLDDQDRWTLVWAGYDVPPRSTTSP